MSTCAKRCDQPAVIKEFAKLVAEAKHEYDVALLQLAKVHQSLHEVKDKKEDGYYSNSVLHAKVNKENRCADVLSELNAQILSINHIINQNQEAYNLKADEFRLLSVGLNFLVDQLISHLMQWKQAAEKTRIDFEKAEEAFQVLKARIQKNAKSFTPSNLAKEYTAFLKQFGDIAKLTSLHKSDGYFEYCEAVERLPPLLAIVNINPAKKSLIELKVLCELTENKALIAEVDSLTKKVEQYYESERSLSVQASGLLRYLDKPAHEQIVADATDLVKEYCEAASELQRESQLVIEELEYDFKRIMSEAKKVGNHVDGSLNEVRRSFETARLEMINANKKYDAVQTKELKEVKINGAVNQMTVSDEMHQAYHDFQLSREDAFAKYEHFLHECDRADDFYERLLSTKDQLKEKYDESIKRFGDGQVVTAYHLILGSNQAFDDLHTSIDMAKNTIGRHKNMMAVQKTLVLQVEIIELIKRAIENNTQFWRRQTSFLGSRYTIKGISVPNGVSKLYRDLQFADLYTSQEVLKTFKETVKLRKNAGTGFFARRALTTTEKFYDLILSIDLSLVTDSMFGQLKAALTALKDDQGGLDLRYHEKQGSKNQQVRARFSN